ncbi:sulfotransferase [Amphritea japonica]|uniref:Glycosyl transferase family 2 n=1 Tax=Amphritea japonica ATCC BAA-1530 TaxID=1278309 RepID=A0A7R6PCB9_9GAMM|nr:sulfotransferase [Amphritea japonica]BBB25496.1 glycosyl transferase family 2 [Amphritea japonica ATCC BAA-1530]
MESSKVCILGMHRSGTSCLAGCLEERGLFLGDVVNASPHNKKGNKENKELRRLNDDVLESSGGTWDRPPEFISWNDEHRQRRDDIINTLKNNRHWGFKDPRVVLTLPFWLEALPDMKFVGTFRHPSAVIASLTKRPGLAPSVAPLKLWTLYNRSLLEAVKHYEFPLICFDRPQDEYLYSIEQASAYLGLPEGINVSGGFFEENIRTQSIFKESDLELGSEEQAIYRELLDKSC